MRGPDVEKRQGLKFAQASAYARFVKCKRVACDVEACLFAEHAQCLHHLAQGWAQPVDARVDKRFNPDWQAIESGCFLRIKRGDDLFQRERESIGASQQLP